MILTQEEASILGHIVVNPQAWADHAESKLGIEKGRAAMLAKVTRHQAAYDLCVAEDNYQDRNARDAAEAQAELDRWAIDLPTAKAKRKAELSTKVSGLFVTHVDPHYLKQNRHVRRGRTDVIIPANIEAYEDALTSAQDEAGVIIDSITTVKECKEYYPVWPTPPKV